MEKIQQQLGARACSRSIVSEDEGCVLQERQVLYMSFFEGENNPGNLSALSSSAYIKMGQDNPQSAHSSKHYQVDLVVLTPRRKIVVH